MTTDIASYVPRYWFGKLPWEDPQTYWKHSPLSLVGNVKTPTLVVVGEQDFRTPVSDSEQYYEALKLRGIADGAGESAWRVARRAGGAAVTIGRQGERYSRLVPTLSRR